MNTTTATKARATAKVVTIKVQTDGAAPVGHEAEDRDTYEVRGLLLSDGRLYVAGAGVDGGDSLFASLDDYEPNGLDAVESATVTEETAEIGLSELASSDVDNVVYAGASLLTLEEQSAVRAAAVDGTHAGRWVERAGAADTSYCSSLDGLRIVQDVIAEAVEAMGYGGRTKVARRLGVSPSWVTRFLAGGANATVTNAAAFAWAAGVRLEVKAVKL